MKIEINTDLIDVVAALKENEAKFATGQIKSVQHAHEREKHLADALTALGKGHGLTFQQPLQIDTRGEFSLVVMPKDGKNPQHYGTGQYGEEFVSILNQHKPRTGTQPTSHMSADNGWCRINHFEAEKMVKQQAEVHELMQKSQQAMSLVIKETSPQKKPTI